MSSTAARRLSLRPGPVRSCTSAGCTWLQPLYLAVFGPPVERRVGSFRFLILYFACATAGGAVYLLAQPTSIVPALGASGAIAGVIAAHLVLFPNATLGSVAPVLFFRVVESTPTVLLLVLWLVFQVFSGVAALTTTSGIAWWAHLGASRAAWS